MKDQKLFTKVSERDEIFNSGLLIFVYLVTSLLLITYHLNGFRINGLSENTSSCCDIFHQLIERTPFNFFAFEISHWVHEIERHAALAQLFDKQFLLLCGVNICNKQIMLIFLNFHVSSR